MIKMKKLLALMLALVLVLAACGGTTNTDQSTTPAEDETTPADGEETTGELDNNSLYLVTDLGTIDDKSFNEGSFDGLKKYAGEVGVEANYIRPAGEGDQIYKQAIDQAISEGAKVVVTPGYLFENAVGAAQQEHPEVKFIAVDFEPNEGTVDAPEYKVADNSIAVLFKEEQSGFLAGYAAVKDGYRKLGFMGGVAVPAVVRFGHGFVAGANAAAEELGEKVEVKFNYTGSFEPKPEIQTMASSWYQGGTEVIFSCGGGIAASVLKAAQDNGGKMIGVDVDQKDMGQEVITSAMKGLEVGVYNAVKDALDGKGGVTERFGVEFEGGVQISDDFSRFNSFTQEDYKAIYDKLVANQDGITDSIPQSIDNPDPSYLQDQMTSTTIEFIQQ